MATDDREDVLVNLSLITILQDLKDVRAELDSKTIQLRSADEELKRLYQDYDELATAHSKLLAVELLRSRYCAVCGTPSPGSTGVCTDCTKAAQDAKHLHDHGAQRVEG